MSESQYIKVMNQIYYAAVMIVYEFIFIGTVLMGWGEKPFAMLIGSVAFVMSLVNLNKLSKYKEI